MERSVESIKSHRFRKHQNEDAQNNNRFSGHEKSGRIKSIIRHAPARREENQNEQVDLRSIIEG